MKGQDRKGWGKKLGKKEAVSMKKRKRTLWPGRCARLTENRKKTHRSEVCTEIKGKMQERNVNKKPITVFVTHKEKKKRYC